MPLGLLWDRSASAAYYRAIFPAQALSLNGWEVFAANEEHPELEGLAMCDVVLIYRRFDAGTVAIVQELVRRGVAIVYDADDDYLTIMEDHPTLGRLDADIKQRLFDATAHVARHAQVMTVTTEPVARRYRDAGVGDVQVVPNHLQYGAVKPGVAHEGTVVGWVAGLEHVLDAERLGIPEALRRLLERHRDVRVECIGVDLALPERYRHDQLLRFEQLTARIAGWDVGLAPLVDNAFNRARSDIKVKEYAARGVPWLASPVEPYLGLGEAQGGRLVEDGDWFKALDRLVRKKRERQRLSANALEWARTQTMQAARRRYLQIFDEAIRRAQASARAA